MFEGLMGALLGAFLAAAATIIVAKWQLKLIADNHREAMEEQNKLLKETFSQQLVLQANEQRIQHQLEFLNKIERYVEEDAWSVYLKGHMLTNSGPEALDVQKAMGLAAEVRAFQEGVSEVSIKFDRALAENAHLETFHSIFRPSQNSLETLNHAISRLVSTLEDYPVNPSQEIMGFIRERFNKFAEGVNDYHNWMQKCRERFQEFRTRIYGGEIIK